MCKPVISNADCVSRGHFLLRKGTEAMNGCHKKKKGQRGLRKFNGKLDALSSCSRGVYKELCLVWVGGILIRLGQHYWYNIATFLFFFLWQTSKRQGKAVNPASNALCYIL